MHKQLLIITGSPRHGGNSDTLAEALARGAQEAGHTVQRFDAGRAQILPCRACDGCFRQGKPCLFDDDFTTLAPLLEAADVVAPTNDEDGVAYIIQKYMLEQ